MTRFARLLLVLAILAALSAPATAAARIDDWQRVVRSRHVSAVIFAVDGCNGVECSCERVANVGRKALA